jgi:hypothetical protein
VTGGLNRPALGHEYYQAKADNLGYSFDKNAQLPADLQIAKDSGAVIMRNDQYFVANKVSNNTNYSDSQRVSYAPVDMPSGYQGISTRNGIIGEPIPAYPTVRTTPLVFSSFTGQSFKDTSGKSYSPFQLDMNNDMKVNSYEIKQQSIPGVSSTAYGTTSKDKFNPFFIPMTLIQQGVDDFKGFGKTVSSYSLGDYGKNFWSGLWDNRTPKQRQSDNLQIENAFTNTKMRLQNNPIQFENVSGFNVNTISNSSGDFTTYSLNESYFKSKDFTSQLNLSQPRTELNLFGATDFAKDISKYDFGNSKLIPSIFSSPSNPFRAALPIAVDIAEGALLLAPFKTTTQLFPGQQTTYNAYSPAQNFEIIEPKSLNALFEGQGVGVPKVYFTPKTLGYGQYIKIGNGEYTSTKRFSLSSGDYKDVFTGSQVQKMYSNVKLIDYNGKPMKGTYNIVDWGTTTIFDKNLNIVGKSDFSGASQSIGQLNPDVFGKSSILSVKDINSQSPDYSLNRVFKIGTNIKGQGISEGYSVVVPKGNLLGVGYTSESPITTESSYITFGRSLQSFDVFKTSDYSINFGDKGFYNFGKGSTSTPLSSTFKDAGTVLGPAFKMDFTPPGKTDLSFFSGTKSTSFDMFPKSSYYGTGQYERTNQYSIDMKGFSKTIKTGVGTGMERGGSLINTNEFQRMTNPSSQLNMFSQSQSLSKSFAFPSSLIQVPVSTGQYRQISFQPTVPVQSQITNQIFDYNFEQPRITTGGFGISFPDFTGFGGGALSPSLGGLSGFGFNTRRKKGKKQRISASLTGLGMYEFGGIKGTKAIKEYTIQGFDLGADPFQTRLILGSSRRKSKRKSSSKSRKKRR